jgi:hypothetical protein
MDEMSEKLQDLVLSSDEEDEVDRSAPDRMVSDPSMIVRRIQHIRRTLKNSITELTDEIQDLERKHERPFMDKPLRQTSNDVFYATLARHHRHTAQLTSLGDSMSRLIWTRSELQNPIRRSKRSLTISKWRQRTMPLRPDTPITDEEPVVRKRGNLNHLL